MGQGKEATAMRKAILVVVLVAASFLGGAFVNGPGLQWIEARLLRSLGLNNGGEIASVDLMPAVSSDTALDESRLAKSLTDVGKLPRAPMPSLLTQDKSPRFNDAEHVSTSQAGSKSQSLNSALADSSPKPMSLSSAKHPMAIIKPLEEQAAPVDPNVKQANGTSSPENSGNSGDLAENSKPDILDTIAALLPSNSESAGHLLPLSLAPGLMTPAKKPLGQRSDGWAIIDAQNAEFGCKPLHN